MTSTDHATGQTTLQSQQLPAGFRFAGVACGIKESGKPDVSLIVSDRPVVAAGVYTQNQIVAAPVVLCQSRTPSSRIRAVVTNSGNANACTGETGMQDAQQMCRQVADLVGCESDEVLVMSTGVIGHTLPMDRVSEGIASAHANLGSDVESFVMSAEAIRTTDKDLKVVCREVPCSDHTYRVAAMAKGAGMIEPNMATLLAVVMTDAPLSPESAHDVLKAAAEASFNRISVDGHTSTNDSMLLLSSGEGPTIEGDALAKLQQQINQASIELARRVVADGEGASHVMAIEVRGAVDDAAALSIARTVASSPLVKTAITGGDPNWGRIVSAAGYAKAKVDPPRVSLKICDTTIYKNGSPQPYDEAALSKTMKANVEVPIELSVGDGPGEARYWASDLTTEYVRFNSEYTT